MRAGLRCVAVFFVGCISGLTTGCGNFFIPVCQANNSCTGPVTASSQVYVANANLATVANFPIPSTAFTSLTGTSYTLNAAPTALAATPKGTLLYVATAAGSIYVYTIASNGALTAGNSSNPVATSLAPTWMAIDRTGNWLFLVSSTAPQMREFQINTTTGALTAVSSTPIVLSSGSPSQVYFTPNNQLLFVGLGSGGMDFFNFTASSGALSNRRHLNSKVPGTTADNALTADNNSAFLFIGEAGAGLRAFTIGTGGALTEVSGSPFKTNLGPSSLVVDSTNAYLYMASRTAGVIDGFTISSTGALTALSGSPFQAGQLPTALSLDSTGKYLIAIANGGNPDLQVFSFDATTAGTLDSVATTATGTDPALPISMAVVP